MHYKDLYIIESVIDSKGSGSVCFLVANDHVTWMLASRWLVYVLTSDSDNDIVTMDGWGNDKVVSTSVNGRPPGTHGMTSNII